MITNFKQQHRQKIRYSYNVGILSLIANILIFGLKYWAGIVSGSVALIADAWHTLMHTISAIILLAGAKISSKPADEKHPFGYGRAELISSILLAVFLAVISFEFLHKSFEALMEKKEFHFGTIVIVILLISIVMKLTLSEYAFWAAKKTDSDAIKADGWHHRSDMLISVIILIGVFVGNHFWWIDGILGILISLLIAYSAYKIAKSVIRKILGEKPEPNFVERLKKYCNEIYVGDLNLHHIHLHRYGSHIELTCHIKLPNEMRLDESDEIITKIEDYLGQKYGIHATIHAEPLTKNCYKE